MKLFIIVSILVGFVVFFGDCRDSDEEKFGTIVQNLRGQLATLSINENIEVVEMMTNALKRMRDNLANLEYEDLEEADPTVMDKDLEAAKAIIAEFSSDKDSAPENSKDKIEL